MAAVGLAMGALLAPEVARSEPESGGTDGGATNVSSTNVNMVGEAFTVRQDGTFPTEVLLARYPRASTEVSDDLTTGFASFADPGFLLRFGIGAGFAASGRRELTAPTWAECLYPQSPQTPTAETRAPGAGVGPTAVAECRPRGSHLAGYATQAAPDGAQSAHLRGGPLTATVDTVALPDGATDVVSASEINDVTIGGVITLRSIRNRAVATTTGRPGGAKAVAEATIGALLVNGNPVVLPSDSIQKLGPALAALAPVVAPAGTFTFDVVPEAVEAAPDGTEASARAAQLRVTQRLGQSTFTFGLGYARAGARTIVNEGLSSDGGGTGLSDGLGGLPPTTSGSDVALQPIASDVPYPVLTVASPPPALLLPSAPSTTPVVAPYATTPVIEPVSPPPDASLPNESAAPALPSAAPATALARGAGGPSRQTVALLGVICAAILIRYLSYSTKLRRL